MAWALSITSIIMLWLMGNKSRWGPIVGIANQVAWFVYVISIEEHGLLLGVVAYTIVHARNLRKWNKAKQVGLSMEYNELDYGIPLGERKVSGG